MLRITGFERIAPYTLRLRFSDRSTQLADFEPLLTGILFAPLRDEALFDQVNLALEGAALIWPNGASFDAPTLHAWPSRLTTLKAESRQRLKTELKDEWAAVLYAQQVLDQCGPFDSPAHAAKEDGIAPTTLATAIAEKRFPALQTLAGPLVRPSAVKKRIGLFGNRGRPSEQQRRRRARRGPPISAAS